MVNHSENKKPSLKKVFCFEESALSEFELVENESNGHNQYMFYVYMIKNTKDKLYTGVSGNLPKRVYYHNTNRGALFTKSQAVLRDKFKIVFYEEYQTLTEARKREI
ncbi:MAG: GIY-YIG nuclease family protein [bacterium]|nr:GIY-YIG nuclease family protein [bacterium]